MKIIVPFAVLVASAAVATSGETTTQDRLDCRAIAKNFRESVKDQPIKKVLEILARDVAYAPGCSCELIKSAITVYKPTPEEVTLMVDAAINAAPERMEEIINCSMAAAPDAKAGILSTASEYGYVPNPLDFPGIFGEHPGGQWQYVPVIPIYVNPPQVTRVDP